jgi:16S rRNA (cytidine1402-2'-O)-methyltransferase
VTAQPAAGTLYLIPTNLAEPFATSAVLPSDVIDTTRKLRHFIAENAKTARAFLKQVGVTRPLQEISIVEIDKHSNANADAGINAMLAPLINGEDVGLVSEAGAPAVADPGALVVAAAHAKGIRVTPLVGPSSILLGLMGSGLNGQRFAFQGYLPQEKSARIKAIVEFERESRQKNMTQIFIETPYRNQSLFGDLIAALAPETRLCIAANLTAATERIETAPVQAWKKREVAIEKVPTLFLFLA